MTDTDTIGPTTTAIGSAVRAVLDAIFRSSLTGRHATRAIAYLDAAVPHGHPARTPLLALADLARQQSRHGTEDSGLGEDAGVLAGDMMAALVECPVEMHTITSRETLTAVLPCHWRLSGITVRMVGGTDQFGQCPVDDTQGPWAGEPTLVFYQDGMPIAQVSIATLAEMAGESVHPGS